MKNNRFKLYELKMYYEADKHGVTIVFVYFDTKNPDNKKNVGQIFVDQQTIDEFQSNGHVVEWAARKMTKHIGDDQFYVAVAHYAAAEGKGHLFNDYYGKSPFDNEEYYPPQVYQSVEKKLAALSKTFQKAGTTNHTTFKPQKLKVSDHKAHIHIAIDGTVSGNPDGYHEDVGGNSDIMQIVDHLPGVSELVVHPVTKEETTIRLAIIDLNDHHKWSREQVADWLETLDVDLRFRVEDDTLGEQRKRKIAELEKQLKQTNENIKMLSDAVATEQEAAFALVEEIDKLKEEK